MNSPTDNLCQREQYPIGFRGWKIRRKMILSTGALIESITLIELTNSGILHPSPFRNILIFVYGKIVYGRWEKNFQVYKCFLKKYIY